MNQEKSSHRFVVAQLKLSTRAILRRYGHSLGLPNLTSSIGPLESAARFDRGENAVAQLRHDSSEISGIKSLLALTSPILRLLRYTADVVAVTFLIAQHRVISCRDKDPQRIKPMRQGPRRS